MNTRYVAGITAAILILGACSDDSPDAACERWDEIQGTNISDAEAVDVLNELADQADNGNVRDRALELATLLEGNATQTEVGEAYEEMDAACSVGG